MWVDEDGFGNEVSFLMYFQKILKSSVADYINPIEIKTQCDIISIWQFNPTSGGRIWIDWYAGGSSTKSKFDPTVVSRAGAVGIMQVIPKYSELTADSLLIPELNIREEPVFYREYSALFLYDSLSWSFALATCYLGWTCGRCSKNYHGS